MLILNISSTAQAQQPIKFTSDSALVAVAATPSTNFDAKANAAIQLPQAPQATETRQQAEQVAEQHPSAEKLKEVVDNINRALKLANRNLEFSVDESTSKQVVKLVDSDTGDLIRQFPTDEMLAISRAIDQVRQGLLLRQKA